MAHADCRQLLQDILDNGWAKARIEERIEQLKATDPHYRRLAPQKPKLAETQIVFTLNEAFVGEFANLPGRIIEALLAFADQTSGLRLSPMRLAEGELRHNAFPTYRHTSRAAKQQRIVVIPEAASPESSPESKLFSPHGKVYRIQAIVVEVITLTDKSVDVRLHLSINTGSSQPGAYAQSEEHAYLTIDTFGHIWYEQFAMHLRTDALVQFSTGCIAADRLLAPVSKGSTTDLDTFFRGARAQLATDLKLLPQYLQLCGAEMCKSAKFRGF